MEWSSFHLCCYLKGKDWSQLRRDTKPPVDAVGATAELDDFEINNAMLFFFFSLQALNCDLAAQWS